MPYFWRTTGWWQGRYAIAAFDIAAFGGGTRSKFTQLGIPPHRYSGHYRGWTETYWTPMKEIIARGTINAKPANASTSIVNCV
jgi:hypothetical protein